MLKKLAMGLALAAFSAAPLAAEPITLKLNSPAPPWSYLNIEIFTPWAEAVTANSEGTLKIQTFFGGTLGNFGNTYDRVTDQVIDIGFILFAGAAGKFKLQDVAGLPFETPSATVASVALWKIFENGVTAKEFDAVRPLGLWTFPNAAIHSREPMRTLGDFKGKKLIASNPIAAKIVTALGATPISLRVDEAYTAIQRGTTDGGLMPFTGMETFKISRGHEASSRRRARQRRGHAVHQPQTLRLVAGKSEGGDRQAFLPAALPEIGRKDPRAMAKVAQPGEGFGRHADDGAGNGVEEAARTDRERLGERRA